MEEEIYWLAGLLEGEGSFIAPVPSAPNRPIISLNMTDVDVVEKVARILGTKVYKRLRQKEHHKDSFHLHIRGKKAVEWMQALRPLMGNRRQQQIDYALSKYQPNRKRRLENQDAVNIRKACANGESVSSPPRKYSISRYTIRLIRDRKTYTDVD